MSLSIPQMILAIAMAMASFVSLSKIFSSGGRKSVPPQGT